jgi:hypothetical protein
MSVTPPERSSLRASSQAAAWQLWSWCREADAPAMAQAARELGVRLRLGEQRLLLLGTPMVDVWIASPPPTPLTALWARVVALVLPAPPGSSPASPDPMAARGPGAPCAQPVRLARECPTGGPTVAHRTRAAGTDHAAGSGACRGAHARGAGAMSAKARRVSDRTATKNLWEERYGESTRGAAHAPEQRALRDNYGGESMAFP